MSSDNPTYSNCKRRIDKVRVIGRVVWFAGSWDTDLKRMIPA